MSSQITKDFKMKSKLRKYADGGTVRTSMLGDGMAARAGGLLSGRGRQVDQAVDAATGGASAPAPAPAPAAPKKGLRSFFGLADGGVSAEGGRVKGPGGRTDDKVGPVMLSDEEYVLPGDTADAIGRDKLDAIRLATHDFKDERKASSLRGKVDGEAAELADGGSWIADGKGNVRKPNAFGDAAAGQGYTQPRQLPPPAPGSAVAPVQPPIGQRPPIDITPPGSRTTPPAQVVDAVTDVRAKTPMTRAMGAANSALRGGAPIAGIAGAVEAGALGGGDLASGYRDQFQKDMGVQTPLGSIAADTARTLASVGDAATFGVAGRVGRGIASAAGGGGFMDGFTSDSARDQFEAARTRDVMAGGGGGAKPPSPIDAAASALRSDQGAELPMQGGAYQSRRLSAMGVPEDVQNSAPIVDSALRGTQGILKTGGTSQFQNLGTYGGNANIYGRSSDPSRPGRINEFVGVGAGASPANEASGSGTNAFSSALKDVQSSLRGGAGAGAQPAGPASGASEINARYDKLAKQMSGMYGPKGQGNLARRMLELEQSRTNALDADSRNMSSLRGQDMTAETSRSNAELNARVQMADAVGRMEQNRATIGSQAQAAQLKALQDAQKTAREGEEKGFDRYTGAISNMFTTVGEDGKQTVDKAAQEQFRAFIEGSDPKAGEKFASMAPQQQQVLLQNFKTMFDMNQARNKTAQSGSLPSNTGGVTNRMDMPVDVREATFNDWWNNNLPLKDYLWSNLPGTNENVVVTESGQPTLYSDYTSTGGERDLDKEKIVRDSVGARSKLRSN